MGDEFPDYYVGLSQTRDSEALERSNFKSALAELGGEKDGVIVARFNHWAVGWVETIMVHKDAKDKVAILQDIENRMADYPVLDEEDYSDIEMEEYRQDYDSWARHDALKMIKKHLVETAPAGDQDMVQRIEDYELSEKADQELGEAVFECFMNHGEAYFDEKTLIESADAAIATILQETGGKANPPNDPNQPELPLEGLSSKQTKCVKCGKMLPVSDMVENVHGAGYLCKEHAKAWNKDASWTKTSKDWETCTNCGGDGHVEGKECPACEGTGRLPKDKESEASQRTARGEEKGQLILSYDQSDVADNQVKWLLEEPDESNDYWMKDEVEEAWEKAGHDADKFKALLKQEGLEGEAEEQARNSAYEDSDIYQFAWDDLKDGLTEALTAKNPNNLPWRLDGSNLGWQARSGYMYVETNDGAEFLNKVLPKTDVTIEVYDEGDALHFKVYHHDAPTGEHYYARPEAPKEEEDIGAESSKRSRWTKTAVLSKEQIDAVEAMLTNDEASSDEELVMHFTHELGMLEQEAREWVAKRNSYLGRAFGSKKAGMVKRMLIEADFADEHGIADDSPDKDVYFLSDQPMTCPKCGARTDFVEVPDAPVHTEKHTCPECKYSFTAEEEEPGDIDEPADDDIVISTEGKLGGMYAAYQGGKQVAKAVEWDELMAAIQSHMDKDKFYPNVWLQDDHGGISIVDMSRSASRDEEIVKRNVELEQAAIDEYRGQAQDASPDLKKVLDHTIEEEREHRQEFEDKKITSAISPEERAQYTWMAKNLKSVLKPILGIPISVKTSGSVRPNPYIEVSSVDWETNKIPNDFRVKVAKALGIEPTSWENVTYGNITDNRVALPSTEWKKVLDSIGVTIPEQPASEPTKAEGAIKVTAETIKDFVDQYLYTALWSSTDDAGNPLDDQYDITNISDESYEEAREDCDEFVEKAGELLNGLDMDQVAHDFWLTRNHHGAGFWDRKLGDVGDKLTEIAHSFGETNLILGDGGKLYLEGSMKKTAADGIRSYGPGKFGTIIDQVCWEMTMAGADDEVSNEGSGEWYGFLRNVTVEEAEKAAQELNITLTDAEKEWFRIRPFIIVGTGEQGFVATNGFSNEVTASKLWDEIVADMTPPEEEMGAEGAVRKAYHDAEWECPKCGDVLETNTEISLHNKECDGKLQLVKSAADETNTDITKCKSCGKSFTSTGFVYCPECADVVKRQERSYTERVRDPQFEVDAAGDGKCMRCGTESGGTEMCETCKKQLKETQTEWDKLPPLNTEAGLSDQVKSLRRKLKELDVDKADPSEIASTVDALEKLEKRLKDQQETRQQRKDEKAKEAEEAQTVTAGLSDQVKTLRKKLKELDVDKADPSEIASTVDALEKLEKRLKEQQETRKTNKEEKAKAAEEAAKTEVTAAGAHQAWDVFLNGKNIDTVFYTPSPDVDADYVKRSLVNHDGYDPNIEVRQGKDLKKKSSLYTEAATNEQVIQMFADDSFPKDKMPTWGTQNLKIQKEPNGWALINYATPIAYRSNDGQTFINTQKYSQTTSKIQSVLKRYMGSAAEVDEAGMKAAMQQTSAVESVDEADKGLHGESSLGKRSDMLPQERGYEPLSTIYFSKPMSEDEQQALLDIIEKDLGVEGGLVGGMNAINLDTDNKETVEAAVDLIGRDLVQETSVGSREASLNKIADGENGYIGYYRGKQFETHAKTSYEAQQKMAQEHGIKKAYEITVVLAEKGGEEVTHKPQDIVGSMSKKADHLYGINSISAKKLGNGDLEISVSDPEELAEIKAAVAAGDQSDQAMYDAFEHLIANGYMWVQPEDIGALTSAPILSDGGTKDDGSIDLSGGANVWWYPNYAVRSPMEDIAETGKTVFTFAPEDKAVESSQKRYAKYFEQFKKSDTAGSAWELDKESRKLKRKKLALKIQTTEEFFKSGGYKFNVGDNVWHESGAKAVVKLRCEAAIHEDKFYEVVFLDPYDQPTIMGRWKVAEKELEPA